MRARIVIVVGLLLGLGWLGAAGAEEPKTEKPPQQTLLFLGDSITRAGGYVRIIAAELTKQNPANPPRVVNRGRSSETVSGLSEAYHPGRRPCLFARLDRELAETRPDWVVACYGINCGIYHPFNEKRFAAYRAGIETLIEKVHAAGSRLILLTSPPYAKAGPPLPEGTGAEARKELLARANAAAEAEAEKDPKKFGYRTPYAYYDRVMARYAEWLLTLDGRKDVWVVDLREPMLSRRKETHGRDPIHPNGVGHAVMAEAFLKRWPAIAAQTRERSVPWDLPSLLQVPKVHPTDQCPSPGMRSFFYEGAEYKGKPTRVFAYYAAPQGKPPAGGWPAAVCAHGGGGTAYPDWVKKWNENGYAAISMDLEGHLPDRRPHENAGPARQNWFSDIGLPDNRQWFYHAVADVIRANSLLRSFPEINADKIGLTGISWGGTIAATVAGVDDRFAFVVPVYGCGFLHESDNEGLTQWFREDNMTAEQFRQYRTKWDPSAHLPYAKMPMYWINGSNDGTFPMDIFQRSALAAAGPSILHVRFRWLHGHSPGWRRRDVYAFADSIVKGSTPLPTAAKPELDAKTRRVWTKTTGKIDRAALCYTMHGGKWQRRYWENAACEFGTNEVSSRLPKGATVFYFNVKDERGNLVSTEFVEVKNP